MPIIPIPGGARGYSFLYTRAGGASDDFVIALPKAMPNVAFLATVQGASGPDDFIDGKVVQADNTTTTIHIVTASPIADGTQLIVTVNGVASRVMPVVTDGITIAGTGVTGDPLFAPAAAIFAWKVGVSWATIYAAMSAVTGPKICLVERDPAGPRSMTNNGGVPTDLAKILFMGIGAAAVGGFSEGIPVILVQDGFKLATFNNAGEVAMLTSKDVSWNFSEITAPIYTSPDPGADRAVFTIEGGQLDGSYETPVVLGGTGLGVVEGTLWLTLRNVVYNLGYLANITSGNSLLFMNNQTTVFNQGMFFANDGGGYGVVVYCDSTCEWHPSYFTDAPIGLSVTPIHCATFAAGTGPDAGKLYSIAVTGGVVTATVV